MNSHSTYAQAIPLAIKSLVNSIGFLLHLSSTSSSPLLVFQITRKLAVIDRISGPFNCDADISNNGVLGPTGGLLALLFVLLFCPPPPPFDICSLPLAPRPDLSHVIEFSIKCQKIPQVPLRPTPPHLTVTLHDVVHSHCSSLFQPVQSTRRQTTRTWPARERAIEKERERTRRTDN